METNVKIGQSYRNGTVVLVNGKYFIVKLRNGWFLLMNPYQIHSSRKIEECISYMKKRLAQVDPETELTAPTMEQVMQKVVIISENPAPEGDSRYWINGYRGCGVYRLAIKNGKIAATIYGGYHNSCPYQVDINKWVEAIHQFLDEKLGKDYTVVKADGSGCEFFLRQNIEGIPVTEYDVPSAQYPFVHHNRQIVA